MTEPKMECSSDAATDIAASGSGSKSSPGNAGQPRADAQPASYAEAQPRAGGRLLIDGWVCDDANRFGHSVCRSVTAPGEGWPASIVLTAGDGPRGSMSEITVPQSVLDWLLKGKHDPA